MPWNQIISMNIRPPRPIDPKNWARLPAANARMRNSERRNIGSVTLASMKRKASSSAAPPQSIHRTKGFPQPVRECPYGSMP